VPAKDGNLKYQKSYEKSEKGKATRHRYYLNKIQRQRDGIQPSAGAGDAGGTAPLCREG
jgi:hypothetical protein